MAKAVVFALIGAAAFIVLIVVFPYRQHTRSDTNINCSLSRRLGYKTPVTPFDPLITKMERSAEKNDNKITDHDEDVEDAYEYFNDQGRLNVTLRLIILFPLLDKAPNDGVVSFNELEAWITQQAVERLNYRTQNELASHDKDGNGAVSFKEYLPQFSDEDIEKNRMDYGEAGWWKEQFTNADVDHNGSLNFDEYKDFLHPEDSLNDKIQKWILQEKIKRMDYDGDGKLSFEEFFDHAYDVYKSYVEFETASADVPTAEVKFAELDVNKDKFLTVEELKPILCYLHPGELSYAKSYTSYLLREADDNKDGKLTLEEMLNHENIFYNTVYDESKEDYDYDDDYHDEF